jgi:hypothetical protein
MVFLNFRVTKMHDSLPLEVFSPKVFTHVLSQCPYGDIVMASWCLLMNALTLATISTKTRLGLLEIGFWFLWLHSSLKRVCGHPHTVCEKIRYGRLPTSYRSRQVCDALNTLVSLMTAIRDSPTPILLNHLGSNPLEYAFGKARIRCSDVNTVRRIMRGFTSEALSLSVNTSLQIVSAPVRAVRLGSIVNRYPSLILHNQSQNNYCIIVSSNSNQSQTSSTQFQSHTTKYTTLVVWIFPNPRIYAS